MNYNNPRTPQFQAQWNKGYKVFPDNKLDLKWVSDYAQEFATALDDNRLTGTQLRSFYNEFIRIRDITASDDEKFVLIKLLVAKVRYRKTAKTSDIPDILVELISNIVEQVGTDMQKYIQACHVMEAIVGFFPKSK